MQLISVLLGATSLVQLSSTFGQTVSLNNSRVIVPTWSRQGYNNPLNMWHIQSKEMYWWLCVYKHSLSLLNSNVDANFYLYFVTLSIMTLRNTTLRCLLRLSISWFDFLSFWHMDTFEKLMLCYLQNSHESVKIWGGGAAAQHSASCCEAAG